MSITYHVAVVLIDLDIAEDTPANLGIAVVVLNESQVVDDGPRINISWALIIILIFSWCSNLYLVTT